MMAGLLFLIGRKNFHGEAKTAQTSHIMKPVNGLTKLHSHTSRRDEVTATVTPLFILSWLLGMTALTVMGIETYAQDLEPRAYANAPTGLNFLIGWEMWMVSLFGADGFFTSRPEMALLFYGRATHIDLARMWQSVGY